MHNVREVFRRSSRMDKVFEFFRDKIETKGKEVLKMFPKSLYSFIRIIYRYGDRDELKIFPDMIDLQFMNYVRQTLTLTRLFQPSYNFIFPPTVLVLDSHNPYNHHEDYE